MLTQIRFILRVLRQHPPPFGLICSVMLTQIRLILQVLRQHPPPQIRLILQVLRQHPPPFGLICSVMLTQIRLILQVLRQHPPPFGLICSVMLTQIRSFRRFCVNMRRRKPYRASTIAFVSRAIISSSCVGMMNTLTFESFPVISTSSPLQLFFSLSMVTPMNPR